MKIRYSKFTHIRRGDTMGNFLLCSIKRAKKPYPIPELGIGIYSAEELCYYMNHYL